VLAPATTAIVIDGEFGSTPVNLVGNFVLAPNGDGLVYGARVLGPKPVSLFIQDNRGPYRNQDSQSDELFLDPANQGRSNLIEKRHAAPRVTTSPPEEAFGQVLDLAGCIRPTRDAVDERILQDIRDRRCRLIGDPADAGGWPELPQGTAPLDSDRDGMPDEWESQHGLDPRDALDGPADADGDGYTNVEEFLNETLPRRLDAGG
jgi:hypothetical protein